MTKKKVPSHAFRGGSPLPPELKAELRRLLAQILIADMRKNPADLQADPEPTVASPWGNNRDEGGIVEKAKAATASPSQRDWCVALPPATNVRGR